MYYYKVYGLKVESEIELKELWEIKQVDNCEVKITLDKIVEEIEGKKINDKEVFFKIKDLGIFKIKDGKEIVVDIFENYDKRKLNNFILGTSFGALLIQRENIAIHGGTAVLNNKGIIIAGDMGAGKSTLTTAFRIKGFKLLSDDVSVVKRKENRINVYPAYPQQKLCEDSLLNLGMKIQDFNVIDPIKNKYGLEGHEGFLNNKKELAGIFVLEKGEVSKVQLEEIIGIQKLNIILKNIYRVEFLRERKLSKEFYEESLKLAQYIPVFKLIRPNYGFTVEEQIKEIVNWREKND